MRDGYTRVEENEVRWVTVLAALALMTGCATSQNVMLAQRSAVMPRSAALVPEEGNSPDMNGLNSSSLVRARHQHQSTFAGRHPETSDAVDAIISYTDVWRWDIVMYLKTVNINMFDAKSGNLLVTGTKDNSAFHNFKSAQAGPSDELIAQMIAKLQPTSTVRRQPLVDVDVDVDVGADESARSVAHLTTQKLQSRADESWATPSSKRQASRLAAASKPPKTALRAGRESLWAIAIGRWR